MLFTQWDQTPQNWRAAYRWMVSQWINRIGPPFDHALVWCWHSCNGKKHSPPTVGTASLLMGDWNYYASSTVLVELDAPKEHCLLSSYKRWNDALCYFLEHRKETISVGLFDDMFDDPLMKHPGDDIQAVLPYIMRDWIIDIRNLPESDEKWESVI